MLRYLLVLCLFSPVWGYCGSTKPYVSLKSGSTAQGRPILGAGLGFESSHLGMYLTYSNYYQESKVVKKGLVSQPSIWLNVYSKAKLYRRTSIFIGGGLGYMMPDHDLDPKIAYELAPIQYKPYSYIDPGIGFNVIGGLEYALTKKVSLSLGLRRVFFDSKYHYNQKSSANLEGWWIKTESPIDLRLLIGEIGVNYYF